MDKTPKKKTRENTESQEFEFQPKVLKQRPQTAINFVTINKKPESQFSPHAPLSFLEDPNAGFGAGLGESNIRKKSVR